MIVVKKKDKEYIVRMLQKIEKIKKCDTNIIT